MTGLSPRERYGGENSSAFRSSGAPAPSPLPALSIRPSGSSRDVPRYPRVIALLARVVHCPVEGFHNSAAWTPVLTSLKTGPDTPPVASTSPVGRTVRL